MWRPVEVTTEPASEPVTLAEVKAQCRIDGTDEDDLLGVYIAAARQHVEKFTGTRLVEQTVVLRASEFADLAELPVGPVQSITSITYLDDAGAEQTLSTDVYEAELTGIVPEVRLKLDQSWPVARGASDAITVTAVAGYETVPDPVRHAILLLISQWFDERSGVSAENMTELPNAVEALLINYRRFA